MMKRYFYAVEYAYGATVLNRGNRPDLLLHSAGAGECPCASGRREQHRTLPLAPVHQQRVHTHRHTRA